jgi:Polyprenyl synthetase
MPAMTAVDGLRDLAGADRMAVQAVVDRFLDQRRVELTQLGASEFIRLLRQSLTGGKWIRPVLCCAGWRAGGGAGQLPADVAVVAGSLELFHAFALVHDDVIDDSDTRRGHPTAHREFAALHAEHAGSDRLGVHCAILLGDLTLGWSYDLLAQAAPARPVRRVLATMRTETLEPARAGTAQAERPRKGLRRGPRLRDPLQPRLGRALRPLHRRDTSHPAPSAEPRPHPADPHRAPQRPQHRTNAPALDRLVVAATAYLRSLARRRADVDLARGSVKFSV